MKTPEKKPQEHKYRWLLDAMLTWGGDVNGANARITLSALTIVSKNMAEYLAPGGHSEPAAQRFFKAYNDALNRDRWLWQQMGNHLFEPLSATLPQMPNFAKAASEGNLKAELVKPLSEGAYVSDWTVFPGWYLVETYSEVFKDILHKKKGEYESNGTIPYEEHILLLFDAVRCDGFDEYLYWVLPSMLISYIIVQSCFESVPLPKI